MKTIKELAQERAELVALFQYEKDEVVHQTIHHRIVTFDFRYPEYMDYAGLIGRVNSPWSEGLEAAQATIDMIVTDATWSDQEKAPLLQHVAEQTCYPVVKRRINAILARVEEK